MKIKNNIIKVCFLPKKKAPIGLSKIEYFVETNDYSIAHDKALDQLLLDVKNGFVRYFDKVAMSEINIIK